MHAGVRELPVIITPADKKALAEMLGDYVQWELDFHYVLPSEPKGITERLSPGENFSGVPCCANP